MTLVYNCDDDMAAAALISGLQISHSYKRLVKHEVTRMTDILSWAQKYIYLDRGCDQERS